MDRVEKEWHLFCLACFGNLNQLPKQQLIDLKRTFYGGVIASLAIMREADEDKIDEFMLDLQAELRQFNEDVKAGKQ